MLHFILILLSFVVRAQHMRPPLVVDFINDSVTDQNINTKPSCRNGYGGKFNDKLCTRNEHACEIQNTFYWPKRTTLEITVPKELISHFGSYPGYIQVIANGSDQMGSAEFYEGKFRTRYEDKIPVQIVIELKILKNYGTQIEIVELGKYVVPEDGKIDVKKFSPPKNKIRFEKGNGWAQNESFAIGPNLGYVGDKPAEIFLNPGKYKFTLSFYEKNSQKHFTSPLSVEMKNENQKIVIDKNRFSTPWKNPLAWQLKTYDSDKNFSINQTSTNSEELLYRIEHILLKDEQKSIDVKDLFNIHLFDFSVKDDKLDEYQKLIKDKKSFQIKVEGRCETATYKPSSTKYPIYASPDIKSRIIGTLEVSVPSNNWDGPIVIYRDSDGIDRGPFKANFIHKKCDGMTTMLHLIKDKKGSFSNLGQGPWGTDAWVNLPVLNALTDPKISLGWFHGDTDIQVTQTGNEYEVVRRSSDTKLTKEKLTLEDFYEKDKFIPTYKCN